MEVYKMGYTTVRISEPSRDLLRHLAKREGTSMQAILQRALESYRRQRFLEQVNSAYAELAGDRQAQRRLAAELTDWEGTLADGLPPERGSKPARAGRRRAGR